ncbi:MAG TPA: UpxY family transcription antiterminator [Prolixibacteraceae bacterium]|nr:UpxY family transcription antiterminator [Prolixibacteraceae bacterium]
MWINHQNKYWHAVYTKSRAEKKVKVEFDFQGIESYLPLQRKLRQWSDRKKWVEVPLISGYVFVKVNRFEYEKVLQTAGVVSYVRFEGTAAIIPDQQIESIKLLLRDSNIEVSVSHKNIHKGDKIEVIGGPLMGLNGTLITIKGKKRVAVLLDQLNISLTFELPINEVRKLD